MPSKQSVIALDGDGVLLDYGTAYGRAWQRAFGTHPVLRDSRAYWPIDRWGVPRLTGVSLERFRAVFDDAFWSSIPAVAGALEACQLLVEHGYELVCVTALEDRHAPARAQNLKDLRFPISGVIATGSDPSVKSPKAEILASLNPVAFVDDYAPYLVGIAEGIHRALIVRDLVGSPNVGEALKHSHSQHADLLEFARWWTTR